MYEQLELVAVSAAPAPRRRTAPPWELYCCARDGDVAGAIAAATPGFRRHFGQPPTVAWVHPAVIEAAGERVAGCEVRQRALPYESWLVLGRAE